MSAVSPTPFKTFEAAQALTDAMNGWRCPSCHIQGGYYHLATCRWRTDNNDPFEDYR